MRPSKTKICVSIIFALHIVGVIGLSIAHLQPYFLKLTPLNLLISTLLVFLFHKEWNRNFYLFLVIVYLSGFAIEAIGVSTGLIFGNYQYTGVLGVKLFNTPLLIGLNWVLLIYVTGTVASKVRAILPIKALVGAVLMVLIDIAIEPVAIKLKFWIWENNSVPFLNYVAWFVTSFLLLFIFFKLPFKKENSIALTFLIVEALFFIVLSFTL